MSSPNGRSLTERISENKMTHENSPRRRRSISGERRERRRHDESRRRSRSHERRRTDRRSYSGERYHRHRARDEEGRHHRERDGDRDRDDRSDRERRERRRKRDEDEDRDGRHKRKRDDTDADVHSTRNDESGSVKSKSERRDRSRDSERRRSEHHSRSRRDDHVDRRSSDRDHDSRRYKDREDVRSERPKSAGPDMESKDRPPPSPPKMRASPTYENPMEEDDTGVGEDSEQRSVFVTQLAARLTARDLGYFFEDKLGEGTVRDSRIVSDRMSRRSKGIGYVEFRSIELVPKAIALSGTIVMGLPIMVQLTESERNRLHSGDTLPAGVSATHGARQIYVGSLHFNLTEDDIKQVFEPFGELDFVDLHRDPSTGRSKGYCFIQYRRGDDARMALEQMEGFELAGRPLRVKTVHEKGTARSQQQDSLDEAGGGNLTAASRQALMQKLARVETPPSRDADMMRPTAHQQQATRCVLLRNMFDPEEESGRDWDKELAEDVKGECEEQYGKVERIKVEKESQGEIYVKFDSTEFARQAIEGLNGRWFGGKQVSAHFISDALMQAHQ